MPPSMSFGYAIVLDTYLVQFSFDILYDCKYSLARVVVSIHGDLQRTVIQQLWINLGIYVYNGNIW